MKRASRHHARRGVAIVAVLIALLLASLVVFTAVRGVARDQTLSLDRMTATRALYAAEAGANMAMRELALNLDEDGDGVVGSISDDGNSGNDPELGDAALVVTVAYSVAETTATSAGRCGDAMHTIELRLE